MFRRTSKRDNCGIIIDDESGDLLVGCIDLQRFFSFAAGLNRVQSFPNGGQEVGMVGVEGLLLVDDDLNLVEQRRVEVLLVLGEGNKHSDCLLQVQIAVNILLVQLFHN